MTAAIHISPVVSARAHKADPVYHVESLGLPQISKQIILGLEAPAELSLEDLLGEAMPETAQRFSLVIESGSVRYGFDVADATSGIVPGMFDGYGLVSLLRRVRLYTQTASISLFIYSPNDEELPVLIVNPT